jgi:hypothetical protein
MKPCSSFVWHDVESSYKNGVRVCGMQQKDWQYQRIIIHDSRLKNILRLETSACVFLTVQGY